MGRHWQNIKLGKGKADAQRAAKFTQLGRAITMAAREKGGDPAMNAKLWTAIEKAKEAFMPKDNIERAIKKGTGELASDALEELVYEGYGPGGAAILVETVTDNRTRTVSNVKNIFSKNGGNLGATGSVAWMFERKGVVRVSREALEGKDEDDAELKIIEAGAEDIFRSPEGWAVIMPYPLLAETRAKIEQAGFRAQSAEIEFVAKETLNISEENKRELSDLLDALEEDEDVKAVHVNVDL